MAIEAQGLAAPRRGTRGAGPGAPSRAVLQKVMERVGVLQLDAVNVLERTQFVVPFSRAGIYDRLALFAMSGPGAPWFEYWGHAASLQPVSAYPLLRWRMERFAADSRDGVSVYERRRDWRLAHAPYISSVMAEVADRGPLAASQLSEPRRREGQWWDRRSDGRRALEMLFADGVLAAWRSPNFERIYDLAERVLPPEALAAPVPAVEDAQAELLMRAAASLGVATAADLAGYWGILPARAAVLLRRLAEEGRLVTVSVAGWRQSAYMLPGARATRPGRRSATVLSPFDSLIWYRDRAERLFGTRYRIEIYVPAPERTYGYYVLPLLLGDEVVARFDLKADRKASVLLVLASHLEPGANPAVVAGPALEELQRLQVFLGLTGLEVAARGDFGPTLAAAQAYT